ncbi:MAG: hypothetical protein CVV34_02650 [Methanomicrobiales archaeon HGW-Methanomicrobiales-5]|nr:MAG: hypothetical protein CVV34_02650 [Methanomicrobiales archaeon HGW-Methanomicrobiales-5]
MGKKFYFGICENYDDEENNSMTADSLKQFARRVYQSLGHSKTILFLVLLLLIAISSPFLYGFYHASFITPGECCGESLPSIVNSEYGFYNANNFLTLNEFSLDQYGVHYVAYNTELLNLTYSEKNNTWIMDNKIPEVIHFIIKNPVLGTTVEGNYTPNVTLVNDTFISDILVINWNDVSEKGYCYRISEQIISPGNRFQQYDNGPEIRSNNRTGIHQYDEFQTTIRLYKPPNTTRSPDEYVDLRYYQMNTVSEENCTAINKSVSGSIANLQFVLEKE